MSAFLRRIAEGLSLWMECIATSIVTARGWFDPPRTIELAEEAGGIFKMRSAGRKNAASRGDADRIEIADGKLVGAVPAGLQARFAKSRAELVLRPDRFIFRQLELPRQAGEFLGGIVRAQIDRLTPWSADDAVFGWSKPVETANGRMVVTVAATARALVAPLIDAIARLGAGSIVVSTVSQNGEAGAGAIKLFEQRVGDAVEIDRLRRVLLTAFAVAGLVAGVAVTASAVVGGDLEARQTDLSARIAARRVAMRASLDGSKPSAMAALERRKHETPASVIVLEALSQVLPDHTYVTELRIAGEKMQVVGITRDAPSLIRLIEQSSHFTRATFFAPTTRSPSGAGEQFHIEAHIEPVNAPRT